MTGYDIVELALIVLLFATILWHVLLEHAHVDEHGNLLNVGDVEVGRRLRYLGTDYDVTLIVMNSDGQLQIEADSRGEDRFRIAATTKEQ